MSGASRLRRPANEPTVGLEAEIDRIAEMSVVNLRQEWRERFGAFSPAGFTKELLARTLTYRLQEKSLGGLNTATLRLLRGLAGTSELPRQVKAGSIIVREYAGVLHEVMVVPGGFCWQGQTYDSLSTIATTITGTKWNGPRFFGLRAKRNPNAGDAIEIKAAAVPPRAGRRSSVGLPKIERTEGRESASALGTEASWGVAP